MKEHVQESDNFAGLFTFSFCFITPLKPVFKACVHYFLSNLYFFFFFFFFHQMIAL